MCMSEKNVDFTDSINTILPKNVAKEAANC